MSLTMNILEIVEENADKHNAKTVQEIELDVGELSGVEYDALTFAFEHAQKSEKLKNAKLVVNKIKGVAVCESCKHRFEISDFFTPCPVCSSMKLDFVQGKEFKIKSFKIE